MNIKKISRLSTMLTSLALLLPALASAHVIVSPTQVAVGAFQTFTVSVPNEKDSAMTQLKLDIPSGLQEVMPTVKPGWDITLDKTGDGEAATIKSITWTGSLDAGYRDDFSFSAQAPAQTTNLDWKAFQIYVDGSTVHWDQKPSGSDDASGDVGPYSITKVINDLAPVTPAASKSDHPGLLAMLFSLAALGISVAAFFRARR